MRKSVSEVSDEDLYSLTPAERRALRGIAKGGWTGSPGQAVCDSMMEKTGVAWQSEAARGEDRAYYAFSKSDERLAVALVARLDALPRRKAPAKVHDHWTKRYREVGSPGSEAYRCIDCDVLVGGDEYESRMVHEEGMHGPDGPKRWYPGQHVIVQSSLNRRPDREGVVAKVARSLFTVQYADGKIEQFRMESGRINDGYGGMYARSPQEVAARRREAAVDKRINALDLMGLSRYPVEIKEQVCDLLEGAQPGA